MTHRQRRVYRSSRNRILLGVAGGLAETAGVDPVGVRALFVAMSLLAGAGLLLYLVLAAVLSVREDDRQPGDVAPCVDETTMVLLVGGLAGVVLIGVGLVALAVQNGWSDRIATVTPWLIVLITLVAGIAIGRRRWED
ncbi:MAG: PspC domain-containing protein [Chloroflexi bacterium]|nr:PspC domain-containing protein [Chloroflexota bacterium]